MERGREGGRGKGVREGGKAGRQARRKEGGEDGRTDCIWRPGNKEFL